MSTWQILQGDCIERMRSLPDQSVNCIVTSPPYWGLRDYGVDGQIGLEESPQVYCDRMVSVFREALRVLRDDGTLWMNLGDTYNGGGSGARDPARWPKQSRNDHLPERRPVHEGLKHKDMVGIPWRVAFALQADGWYLRSDIIWHKPTPMPESIKDRPTKAHEYVFLMAKSEQYWYDADAIKEPGSPNTHARGNGVNPKSKSPSGWDKGPGGHRNKTGRYPKSKQNESFSGAVNKVVEFRNKRTVWTIQSTPFPEAHFATFPEALVEPCIKAGCPEGGVVLDPFSGAGTTGVVAGKLGRNYIGIELNPEYVEMSRKRIGESMPMFNSEVGTKTPLDA